MRLPKCIKGLVSENPLAVNVLTTSEIDKNEQTNNFIKSSEIDQKTTFT